MRCSTTRSRSSPAFGKAGTGKTLLSTACALHQMQDEEFGRYDGVSITRPVIALGKDIGFLPGSLEEKMRPWLQPYYDALEVLIPSKPPKEPQFAARRSKKEAEGDDALRRAAAPQPVAR
jgi:PhoH-like ATPase